MGKMMKIQGREHYLERKIARMQGTVGAVWRVRKRKQ